MDGYIWYGVDKEDLRLVWRVWGVCKSPRKSVGVKDAYGGPEMGVKVFKCVWRT